MDSLKVTDTFYVTDSDGNVSGVLICFPLVALKGGRDAVALIFLVACSSGFRGSCSCCQTSRILYFSAIAVSIGVMTATNAFIPYFQKPLCPT